jgi:hypothetical protein
MQTNSAGVYLCSLISFFFRSGIWRLSSLVKTPVNHTNPVRLLVAGENYNCYLVKQV